MAFDVSQTRILMLGRLHSRGGYPLQFRKTSLNNYLSFSIQFRRSSLKWLEKTPIKVIVYKWIQLRIFKYVSHFLSLSIHLGIYPFYHFPNIEPNIRSRLVGWETLAPVYPFLVIKVWKVPEGVINRSFPQKPFQPPLWSPFPRLSYLSYLYFSHLFGIVRGIRVATSNVS